MLYPMVLDLSGRDVLIVGAGAVAERKIRRVLQSNGVVRVVSPQATDQVKSWAASGQVTLIEGDYHARYIGDAALVFAATNDATLNDEVVRDARRGGVFANSAAGALQDFVVPASGNADGLGVAVWSGSPALSKRLRDDLLERIDERWRLAGRIFDTLRVTITHRGEVSERGAFWRNLAAGVPNEFRSVAVAKRFVRAVGRGSGLPLGAAESDALFEVTED